MRFGTPHNIPDVRMRSICVLCLSYTGALRVILFTTLAPSPLAAELSGAGISVHECLAISEVLALAAEHFKAHIVIAPNVERERARVIQQHYPTLDLNPNATAADIIWELSHRLPINASAQ